VNHVVRKILIKIGKRVRILTQGLVLSTEPIARSNLSKSDEIDDVESTNVVRLAGKMILPITTLPESESFHVFVRVTKRGVTVWGSSQIQIAKLFQIRSKESNIIFLTMPPKFFQVASTIKREEGQAKSLLLWSGKHLFMQMLNAIFIVIRFV
jgi:hypothetical protein